MILINRIDESCKDAILDHDNAIELDSTDADAFGGRGDPEAWVFPSKRMEGPLSRQAIAERIRRWGKAVHEPR